ncbi:uncharacterized protein BDV14DRAFT_204095 [Aspergillus stella-maris]|uniref:uncharacterized protein n=1 Tax=Aspergillus stella-maris TaxID=1810926 RepID=UPI003CCD9F3C
MSPTQPTPQCIALASFANMFSVGTLYALSILQTQLPRLLDIPQSWAYAPFACASLGLSLGVGTCSSLVKRLNARTAAAAGSVLWGVAVLLAGHFLMLPSFGYFHVALFVGGIGVGWTYLAVVVWIGGNLPVSSLARTAIGPLGFSSGAAGCFTLSSVLDFDGLALLQLGGYLKLAGGGFVTVGVTTLLLIPGVKKTVQPDQPASSFTGTLPGRFFFQVLLFFNALPGMTLFAAFLPTAKYHTTVNSPYIIPLYLTPLALGGILSPTLSCLLRPKTLFSTLLTVRGIALLTFAYTPSKPTFLLTLGIILFAHGVGFSTLPGIIKSRLAQGSSASKSGLFAQHYGLILTTWGLAGVVGSILNTLFISETDDFTPVAGILAVIVLSFAGCMRFVRF